MDPLYQTKARCHVCETEFETSRLRPSFKKGQSSDTDFYVRYKEPELNPDYYVVRVCPACGYAFTENFSTSMTDVQKKRFYEKVTANWSWRDYGGRRNWQEALETYQLALVSAQIKEESDRVVAGLLHHIAWLHREKGNRPEEERFLQFALDAYVKVYEYEGIQLNNARLMYLIGELNRRLRRYQEAVLWFSRVVNDKKIVDAAMISASREQWAKASEEMKQAKADS